MGCLGGVKAKTVASLLAEKHLHEKRFFLDYFCLLSLNIKCTTLIYAFFIISMVK